jgi:hypothetical protein
MSKSQDVEMDRLPPPLGDVAATTGCPTEPVGVISARKRRQARMLARARFWSDLFPGRSAPGDSVDSIDGVGTVVFRPEIAMKLLAFDSAVQAEQMAAAPVVVIVDAGGAAPDHVALRCRELQRHDDRGTSSRRRKVVPCATNGVLISTFIGVPIVPPLLIIPPRLNRQTTT